MVRIWPNGRSLPTSAITRHVKSNLNQATRLRKTCALTHKCKRGSVLKVFFEVLLELTLKHLVKNINTEENAI